MSMNVVKDRENQKHLHEYKRLIQIKRRIWEEMYHTFSAVIKVASGLGTKDLIESKSVSGTP